MATPAERKALIFFGLVAVLGASVRVWRSYGGEPGKSDYGSYVTEPADQVTKSVGKSSKPRRTSVRKTANTSRSGQINRDSNLVVDLDRATAAEIDALGLLPTGMGRLIVADRDSFGPFGSLNELRRVPFLTVSTLRKLAPRVTFSRVPRPRNTVIDPRAIPSGRDR
ncbi:MAG: helix-hairpin-helix domain-containing protein [Gemmatimonadaceae bacterium]